MPQCKCSVGRPQTWSIANETHTPSPQLESDQQPEQGEKKTPRGVYKDLWRRWTPATPFLLSRMWFLTDITSAWKWSSTTHQAHCAMYACCLGFFQEVTDVVACCDQTFHCSCLNMKKKCPYYTEPWISGLCCVCGNTCALNHCFKE